MGNLVLSLKQASLDASSKQLGFGGTYSLILKHLWKNGEMRMSFLLHVTFAAEVGGILPKNTACDL